MDNLYLINLIPKNQNATTLPNVTPVLKSSLPTLYKHGTVQTSLGVKDTNMLISRSMSAIFNIYLNTLLFDNIIRLGLFGVLPIRLI